MLVKQNKLPKVFYMKRTTKSDAPMPIKTPQVKAYLKQLSKLELLKLAERKKARIPASWEKSKIVDTLSAIVSASDVTGFVSKPTTTKTKEAQGFASALKGRSLEDKAVQMFTTKGFQCNKNIRLRGMEIDVFGCKKGGIFSDDKFIIAECKNKTKVTPEDLKKFIGNMKLFIKIKGLNEEYVQGYLVTTGVFDKDVTVQARAANIQLKRAKL